MIDERSGSAAPLSFWCGFRKPDPRAAAVFVGEVNAANSETRPIRPSGSVSAPANSGGECELISENYSLKLSFMVSSIAGFTAMSVKLEDVEASVETSGGS